MLTLIIGKHRYALLIALVVLFIFFLPHIIIPMQIDGKRYDPLEFFGSSISMEEVYTYVPEVQEILEGKPWISDTQLFEYKNKSSPYVGETFLAYVMALIVKTTGSMTNAFVAADAIFPPLAVLIVYILLYNWTKQPAISLAGSVVSLLFAKLAALVPYVQKVYQEIFILETHPDFLFFSRNFHPQLSFVFYIIAVLLVWKAINGSKNFFIILAGVSVGLQFYSYLYAWTSLVFGLIILFGYTLIRGDRQTLKRLLVMGTVAGIVASWYMAATFNFRFSPGGEDFFLRSSSAPHKLALLTLRYVGFLVLFFLLFPVEKGKLKAFIISMWSAPVILPILTQWLLSRNLEGDHWLQRFTMPWTVYGAIILAGVFMERSATANRWIKLLSSVVIIISLVSVVRIQISQSFQRAEKFALNEPKKQLYDWINNNISSDSVIASIDWETVGTLPAFTAMNNFAPIGIRSIAPTKELEERYLWLLGLYDANPKYVRLMFTSPSTAGAGDLIPRVFYFTYSNNKYLFDIPRVVTEKMVDNYLLIKNEIDNGAKPPYRLDYLLVSPTEKMMIGKNSQIWKLEKVLENKKYALYKYN